MQQPWNRHIKSDPWGKGRFLGVVGDWGNPLWIVVMGFEKVLESTDESRVSMGRTHR